MSEQLLISFEQWRPVKGYEGIYSVSNLGNVRRENSRLLEQPKARLLKLRIDKDGYSLAHLCASGIPKKVKVHRLVAEAFLDPVEGKTQVNHKNGKKPDNQVSNLEWCDARENAIHAYKVLGKQVANGEAHHWSKLTTCQVIEIRMRHAKGESVALLSNAYSMSLMAIWRIVRHEAWKQLGHEH